MGLQKLYGHLSIFGLSRADHEERGRKPEDALRRADDKGYCGPASGSRGGLRAGGGGAGAPRSSRILSPNLSMSRRS